MPVRTPLVKPGDDVLAILSSGLKKIRVRSGDIVVVTSKILAIAERSIVDLRSVAATRADVRIAKKYSITPELAHLIRKESVSISGGSHGAVLTLMHGSLIANAGIDLSNTPQGTAVLLPRSPERWAERIRSFVKKRHRARVGVIITDSFCIPRRSGTLGIALAIAGFQGIRDERGKKDLFGRTMRLTTVNVADTLATSANLIMGERQERIPAAVIRNSGAVLSGLPARRLTRAMTISRKRDIFSASI